MRHHDRRERFRCVQWTILDYDDMRSRALLIFAVDVASLHGFCHSAVLRSTAA